MGRNYQDKEWLETQYVAIGKTTDQIAADVGVTKETIRRWLHKHNLPVRSKGLSKGQTLTHYEELRDEDWLREQYIENERPAGDIAAELGCVEMTVLNGLERQGIERRDKGTKTDNAIGSKVDERLSDKDWLVTQLLQRERSMADIARQLDVTVPAVVYWVDKFGVEYESDSVFGVRDKQYQQDPKWGERRETRLQIDNFTCQDCGESDDNYDRSLDVHHLRRKDEFVQDDGTVDWEKANAPENLISLCRSCHIKRHTNN